MQLNQALGCDINPKFADPRPGDVKESYADISRAVHYLQYEPKIQFQEGIKKQLNGLDRKSVV